MLINTQTHKWSTNKIINCRVLSPKSDVYITPSLPRAQGSLGKRDREVFRVWMPTVKLFSGHHRAVAYMNSQ